MSLSLCFCRSDGSFFGRWFQNLILMMTLTAITMMKMILRDFGNMLTGLWYCISLRFLNLWNSALVGHLLPMIWQHGSELQLFAVCVNLKFTVIVRMKISVCQCLYTFEKLVVLKLYKSIVLDVPMEVCLSSLKYLHLVSVEYKNKQSHRMLLSGCPVLEELVLDKNGVISLPFYVVVPSLQRLSIIDTCEGEDDSIMKVVINAPSLKYLNIVDTYDYGLLCLSENMPEMVEANVNVVYKSPETLMGSLTSVKRLSLCLSTSMIQHRIVFYQLVHLQLCPCVKRWWDLLTWMLESSPKLQVLKLDECKAHRFVEEKPIKGRWGQPSSVPECLLFHLNTFEWNYYNGRQAEKKMVAYILRNAKRLKTAEIYAWRLGSEEGARKLKELASLHRASKSCQLLLDC